MGTFAARQVTLLPFPFSDLSASKLRPALVLAEAGKGDWVLCQITSNPYADVGAVALTDADFVEGGLQRVSYARPGKLFTANETLFQRTAGTLSRDKHAEVVKVIVELLRVGV
ncbi:MAG: MazF family transcriptional regulator [Methylicorpusculum sp.]|uniref:MazF family transcriptional regulator n=1 Tax=Methylicorpusculum sp. TaxID=2713644 RepID=UPI002725B577|nr:MazF family transcriptional regulator [Methylicorpusculum sp.]MDO8844105.1 MazF family transcriptional regulator [Methylicorpusculum sp.]MDO8940552.1 MazF family transcriptional regulator [Methylicorpusculum sp.]MDP2204441.1 MazF family transcriptional regulator [Methylicorpusculum sp.]